MEKKLRGLMCWLFPSLHHNVFPLEKVASVVNSRLMEVELQGHFTAARGRFQVGQKARSTPSLDSASTISIRWART